MPALKRRARATTVVRATIPASVAEGSRYVLACAGKACRAARTRVTITASADPSKTSAALIEADRKAGKLSNEKALSYRAFAVFGDSRLPARYSGDVTAEEDDSVMREVADAWPTLSRRARRGLARYLAPPASRGGTAQASAAANEDPCDTEDAGRLDWKSIPAAGGNVRINWRADRPDDGKNATQLAADITTAYARFKEIMGREPLSDAKVDCWHGKDGALDIYFDRVYGAEAITVPSAKTKYTSPDCEGMPSFIVSNPTSTTFTMRFVLAHELFHAFQNAFPYKEGCQPYKWFDEASANWAAHSAFPTDDSEHFFTFAMESPDFHLHYRDYHAWPFVLWMEKTFGERSIRTAYEAFGRKSSLPGVDQAIGGFRRNYLDFARHAWNQEPFPTFKGWDRYEPAPRDMDPHHLFLAGQRSRTAYVRASLGNLGRAYRPFDITDERVKEVVFRNRLTGDPDARVGAILRLKSGATRFEDWSGRQRVTFCRERPNQDIASMVIVYANSSLDDNHYVEGTPEIGLRDSCEDLPWHFEVLDASLETHANGGMPGSGQHICGAIAGMPISGQTDFKASTLENTFDRSNDITMQPNGKLQGEIGVRAPAKFAYNLNGCELLQDPPVACSTAFERNAGDDGHWDIGFSMEAASKDAESATLNWWIEDPSVGFFDASDEVCNVFEIWHAMENGADEQEIPLEQLSGTEPVTLYFHGNDQWTETQLGQPAHLAYDWTYILSIRRVDESGNPL